VTVAGANTPGFPPPAGPAPSARAPRAAGGRLPTGRSEEKGRRLDPSDGAPHLECRVAFADDTAWVRAIGEVDLATVALVAERLDDVRAAHAGHVILDLREATFVDSTGLHLAVEWQKRARREGFTFALAVGPGAVQRTIDISGLGAVLTIVSEAP
jgi:anti-sigma B factor antagonist